MNIDKTPNGFQVERKDLMMQRNCRTDVEMRARSVALGVVGSNRTWDKSL